MTWKLSTEEIVKHWELIKYGAAQVLKPKDLEKYSLKLLSNLLRGHFQCWFVMDKERQIKALLISSIRRENIDYLMVDGIYGFRTSTNEEWGELLMSIIKFSKNRNLEQIISYTSNPKMIELAALYGVKKTEDVYRVFL